MTSTGMYRAPPPVPEAPASIAQKNTDNTSRAHCSGETSSMRGASLISDCMANFAKCVGWATCALGCVGAPHLLRPALRP